MILENSPKFTQMLPKAWGIFWKLQNTQILKNIKD